ncbi:MAG: hypothetical protein QF677_03120 [Arenicellales bacterium]|jgi:ABC-type transport system involved in multi-copper enzyme maturation permease subunit|nr:hypothetical protein [Arenicellales bacterium]|tara:strand:+ start:1009 stop:1170 length:162 start_codon:yes stop_codon:yes gene_type:complete
MERTFLLFGLSLLVLAFPVTGWWLRATLPWYLPFLIWLVIILLIPWAHRRIDN